MSNKGDGHYQAALIHVVERQMNELLAILRPFHQYFSHITTVLGDNVRLCAINLVYAWKDFRLKRGSKPRTLD